MKTFSKVAYTAAAVFRESSFSSAIRLIRADLVKLSLIGRTAAGSPFALGFAILFAGICGLLARWISDRGGFASLAPKP